MAKERKPTGIEDQALTVYHFWLCRDLDDAHEETYARHLNGLFELLRDRLPQAAEEAFADAQARIQRVRKRKQG